jgi:uncharacterized protein (DUF934 family)
MSEPAPLLKPLAPATTKARLWKSGRFVADPWTLAVDPVAPPIAAHTILPLAIWRAHRSTLAEGSLPLGLLVEAGETLELVQDGVDRLQLVALRFPKFTDGRAYSTARRLREQGGFLGEVRAVGDVLLDQVPLMLRAGFDAFEIVDVPTLAALEAGNLPAVQRVYQTGSTIAAHPWLSRRAIAGARP